MVHTDSVVVINAGSSSIKFSLYDGAGLALAMRGKIENLYAGHTRFIALDAQGATVAQQEWREAPLDHAAGMRFLIDFAQSHLDGRRVVAVGHRIVHGGVAYSGPQRLDAQVLDGLDKLVPLAPLHLPHNLAPVRSMLAMAPHVPQVGCFDTAFHVGQPEQAQAFALPERITSLGIRRYGFHGLSYEYIASVLPQLGEKAPGNKVVAAHLGNGASMCAMAGGRSVASTMGFTAVDGLPMGTRCGALDPGVVLYLMQELGMDVAAVQKLIYQESGLLGVSGLSSDMRTLEQSDDPRAKAAIALMVYRISRELGSLAAALGGLDTLVFSGGIGENSAALRAAVCANAGWLGVQLDHAANLDCGRGVVCISKPESPVAVWVVPANEELMIARHTLDLLSQELA